MACRYDTKILVFLCCVGLTAFVMISVGFVSDHWLLYRRFDNVSYPVEYGAEGRGNSSTLRLSDAEESGLWKFCYRDDVKTEDERPCQNIHFGNVSKLEVDDPLYQYLFSLNEQDIPVVSCLVILCIGELFTFLGEAFAIVCLKIRVKKWYTCTAVTFILAGCINATSLVLFVIRRFQLLSAWFAQEDMIIFGWSFMITWVGTVLCLFNSIGYIWLVRVHTDTMM